MKPIDCSFGQVELITLKRFLEMIAVKLVDDRIPRQEFNTLAKTLTPEFKDLEEDIRSDEASYKRGTALLFKGDRESILTSALLYQAKFNHIFNNKPVQIFEDMIVNHMYEFGDTKYLVRISPRHWMAASLNDFLVFQNSSGIGLGCLAQVRTVITSVNRLTAAQAQSTLEEITGNVMTDFFTRD